MRFSLVSVLVFASATLVPGQVVEVHGGTSTLFDSKGGEIEFRADSYDASFGGGTIGSRFLGGAKLTKRFEGSTLSLGSETIPFNLPTDIFGGGFLTAVGGSLRSTLPSASVLLFGGMMSANFDSPFFQAVRGLQPAAILLFDGRVAPTISVASRMILARQVTMIEGIGWRPARGAQFAASGGVGAGKGYGAVSASVKYSIFDLKTAYIQTSPGFRRADVDTILTAEPNRLNAIVTVTPNRRVSMTVGHSQYLMPLAGSSTSTRSSIDQVEANTKLKGVALSASIFRSIYETGKNKAFVLSADRAFGPRVSIQASYLDSNSGQGRKTRSLITNVSESLSSRWSVSQVLTAANGQTTLNFGTAFLSNLATVSVDYETYYLPSHLPSPFEQILLVNADLNLSGRATLHGTTFVAADGSVKHTVAASGVFVRNGDPPPATEHNTLERFVILGRVVDELNRPVEGAALLIDRIPVYTDSDGNFILREREARFHSLQVLGKQFLDGGEYVVVNTSHNVHSTLPDNAAMTIVVVQRIVKQCAQGLPCKG